METTINGLVYDVTTEGNGFSICVNVRTNNPGSRWFEVIYAQDEDAAEFVELFREHGAKALIDYLDSAGVDVLPT